jgi:uncharacterized protein (TIGR03086 family)
MTPIEQLAQIVPTVSDLVDRIEPGQLDDPTPCRRFTVRDVLDHMLVLGGSFAYAFRGEEPPTIEPPPRDGRVPAAEFRKTMDDLLDAVRSPGAMERTVPTPMGEMPGETFARLVAFDGLIHGWDLARSTGQEYRIADAIVADVDSFARAAITDAMRDGDTFDVATTAPADADRLERLVAFSGRTL